MTHRKNRELEQENTNLRAELTERNGELARMQRARNDAITEVERLREVSAAHRAAWDNADAGRKAAESRLAATTELLELARDAIDESCWPVWWEKWRAFLADQPAAPVQRCFVCRGCNEGDACEFQQPAAPEQPPCADCGSTTEERSCCPLCGKGPFCQHCAERPVDCCEEPG